MTNASPDAAKYLWNARRATVDDRLVWGVVERDLSALLTTLTRMLTQAEQ